MLANQVTSWFVKNTLSIGLAHLPLVCLKALAPWAISIFIEFWNPSGSCKPDGPPKLRWMCVIATQNSQYPVLPYAVRILLRVCVPVHGPEKLSVTRCRREIKEDSSRYQKSMFENKVLAVLFLKDICTSFLTMFHNAYLLALFKLASPLFFWLIDLGSQEENVRVCRGKEHVFIKGRWLNWARICRFLL